MKTDLPYVLQWADHMSCRQERKEWEDVWRQKGTAANSQNIKYSDATLQVLNNNNLYNFDVVFKDLFPVDLSTIPFDVTGNDNDFFTASATFRYLVFEVREKASSMRIRR